MLKLSWAILACWVPHLSPSLSSFFFFFKGRDLNLLSDVYIDTAAETTKSADYSPCRARQPWLAQSTWTTAHPCWGEISSRPAELTSWKRTIFFSTRGKQYFFWYCLYLCLCIPSCCNPEIVYIYSMLTFFISIVLC